MTDKTSKKSQKSSLNKIENELVSMLKELNPNEIKWLITQTKTIIDNHRVEDVNKSPKNPVNTINESKNTSKSSSSPARNQVDIIDIVQSGKSRNFNIMINNIHLFLNLSELKSMLKIAMAANDAEDGARRLYRWCCKERNDILIDGGISNHADKKLEIIYSILREQFTLDQADEALY